MATREIIYQEIRSDLKTGDIVLFSGKYPRSWVIRGLTRSPWSHVGMVYLMPEHEQVHVWESTKPPKGRNPSELRNGVQLSLLSNRVRNYNGSLAIRRLRGVSLSSENLDDLKKLRKELDGKPYEEDLWELFSSAYEGPFGENDEEDLSSLFCSELVAEAYQCLGLLGTGKPSNEYVPADFSVSRRLELLRGNLGPEINLLWETHAK